MSIPDEQFEDKIKQIYEEFEPESRYREKVINEKVKQIVREIRKDTLDWSIARLTESRKYMVSEG